MSIQRQIGFWVLTIATIILFLYIFRSILLPFVAGMAIAYMLDPVADRLQKLGLGRVWATLSILVFAVLVFIAVLLLLLPVIAGQVVGLLEALPGYVRAIQGELVNLANTSMGRILDLGQEQIQENVGSLVQQGVGWLATVLQSLWSGGQAMISVVSLLVVTPVVAFYLLWDWDDIVARTNALLPRDHADTIRRLAREMDDAVSGFVRGQFMVSAILGTFYAVALGLAGLKFGILIGLIAGLISFIPYVGSLVGLLLSAGVAFAQFWSGSPIMVLVVIAIFAVGQFFEGNILQPKLVGQSVGLHPVWLMFALFAFAYMFGFVGMLIAVPAAAAVGVLVRFAVARYKTSPVYLGSETGPAGERPDL